MLSSLFTQYLLTHANLSIGVLVGTPLPAWSKINSSFMFLIQHWRLGNPYFDFLVLNNGAICRDTTVAVPLIFPTLALKLKNDSTASAQNEVVDHH